MVHDDKPVPLERCFSAVARSTRAPLEQETLDGLEFRKPAHWPEIDEGYRSVILGEAGAGKTFEMRARAQYVAGQRRYAFCIRIEGIRENFETAFDVGSEESFEQWLNSQSEAWIYLDSVDEARLSSPTVFKKAIRRFSDKIKDARLRAHICISSRPYAWRPKSDPQLIEDHLPFPTPRAEPKGANSNSTPSTVQANSALEVYWLRPLEKDEIRRFAAHRSASNPDHLINELARLNLLSIAGRPFDLQEILRLNFRLKSCSYWSQVLD